MERIGHRDNADDYGAHIAENTSKTQSFKGGAYGHSYKLHASLAHQPPGCCCSRSNSVRSRNLRLSAIRTFFRYLALRDPDRLGQITQVMAIPVKRQNKKLIGSLTRDEVEAILAAPDRSVWIGRRDYALLLTMYNSGARVSEITTLLREQVRFGATTYLQLHGKGRKERTVPLWPHTARVLETWFRELANTCGSVAFPNARGHQMARDGVEYILRQAVQQASRSCPTLATRSISPHVVRHATATHLLQSGVDIAVIALWLGHESIEPRTATSKPISPPSNGRSIKSPRLKATWHVLDPTMRYFPSWLHSDHAE